MLKRYIKLKTIIIDLLLLYQKLYLFAQKKLNENVQFKDKTVIMSFKNNNTRNYINGELIGSNKLLSQTINDVIFKCKTHIDVIY